MTRRFYPAVLERGAKGAFALWFPDFPGVVAAARTQEDAVAKAEAALDQAVVKLAERNKPLPEPTPFERIELPSDCRPLATLALGIDPPSASERVNIYLPRRLLGRVDQRAAELGMSRSSYFGWAASLALAARGTAGLFVPKDLVKSLLDPATTAARKRPAKP